MKMYLISDNLDTYTGMRLAGIEGIVIYNKNEFLNALDQLVNNKEIGIILIVERFYREFFSHISEIKLNRRLPLLVSIPDRHGSKNSTDFMSSYINDAIGIKL